jgi:hypothetical protein
MRDLSLLCRLFEQEFQRLEAHDPRFQQITDLAKGGQYTEAANEVAALAEESLYDVRLLGYYAYATFHEDGLTRLPEVFEAVGTLIQQNWKDLPPSDKRMLLLSKSVAWLFQTVLDTLKYHQAKKDERWADWMKGLTEEQLAAATQRAQELMELLPEPTFHSAAEFLGQVMQWLREQRNLLAAARAQQTQEAEKAQAPQSPPPQAAPAPASTFLLLGQQVQLRGSAQFVELCNKLKAFEMLVARKDFGKAALVSDDILAALDSFDPRRYFPELFATFGALLNKHVQNIQPHWENKESVEWKTLAQFYQVDLERFVGRE